MKSRPGRASCLECLLLLLAVCLGSTVVFSFPGNRLFSDRQEIVNTKPKYGSFTFDFDEQRVLAESAADPHYIFQRIISDVAVDSTGCIYLLEHDKISKYDARGKFVMTVGRKGQGPGEYMNLRKMFIDAGDNLYVNDQGHNLLKFDPRGAFVQLIQLEYRTPFMPPEARGFIVDEDRIISFREEFTEKGAVKSLVRASAAGAVEKQLALFLDPSIQLTKGAMGGVAGGRTHAYTPAAFFCPVGEGRLCYGENTAYRLTIMDDQGNIEGVFSCRDKAPSVTAAERQSLGQGVFIPPQRPFFKALLGDDKGRIYVVRTRSVLEPAGPEEIDIFSAGGVHLYRSVIDRTPLVIRDGCIYALTADEQGYRTVLRLRIKNDRDFKWE